MDQNKFGKFISSLRAEKHLTQEQLADKLNINYKTISKWECGKAVPDFETIIQLSKEFNVSLYELSIGERVESKHITKEDILKIVNKNEIKKIKLKKRLIILFSGIAILIGIISFIYAINNFNTTKVYELQSIDSEYRVSGTFSKNKGYSVFAITKIGYLGNNEKILQTILNNYSYELISNDKRLYYYDKNFQIKNHNNSSLDNLLESINILLTTDEYSINNINQTNDLVLVISYTEKDDKNKIHTIEIKINLVEKYSNNQLW